MAWSIMCFLVASVTMLLPDSTRVLIQNSVPSPLGGISLAGVVRGGAGVPPPNRVLNRYSLVYLFEGHGSYSDDHHEQIPIKPGDVIQLAPHTRHWYGPKGHLNWHEVYLIFEGPVFDTWAAEDCFDIGQPVVSLAPIDYWRDRFLSTIGGGGAEDRYGGIAEVIRLQSLLLDIQKALRAEPQKDSQWVQRAKHALQNAASSQEAALSLGLSYESFRKKFRRSYGIPPARYHANLVMERACELLATSDRSVKDIARTLEYCDEFHFSKRFSQIIGCSPSTYRSLSAVSSREG